MAGGVLPDQFWTASEHNVRGGCEYGFLSTTTQGEVAFQYAAQQDAGAGIVFEIQMGMIDRGASLQWLSQYPAEEEILFAPLTGVRPRATQTGPDWLPVLRTEYILSRSPHPKSLTRRACRASALLAAD
eukprot:7015698-Prymnesium_polylepis.2